MSFHSIVLASLDPANSLFECACNLGKDYGFECLSIESLQCQDSLVSELKSLSEPNSNSIAFLSKLSFLWCGLEGQIRVSIAYTKPPYTGLLRD